MCIMWKWYSTMWSSTTYQWLCLSFTIETWAVNASAFRSTNFVDQREFKRAIAVGGCEQAWSVDVVAEADIELLIVEAGAYLIRASISFLSLSLLAKRAQRPNWKAWL